MGLQGFSVGMLGFYWVWKHHFCWESGPVVPRLEGISAPRGVAKHSVCLNTASPFQSSCPVLAMDSSCSLLKAGVCSIMLVENQLPGQCAELAPHCNTVSGIAGWQGCTGMGRVRLPWCCIFSHIAVSHRKVKAM